MQKAMSEPGAEALLTSTSSKAAGIHKMASLEQKRLVLRVKHIRSGSARAAAKAHIDVTSAAMSVTAVNASRLLSFLGHGRLGSDPAGLEAADERCAAPLTVPSGIFLRELAHLMSAGAAGTKIAGELSAAPTSPPATLLQIARKGGEGSATRRRVAEGHVAPAAGSPTVGTDVRSATTEGVDGLASPRSLPCAPAGDDGELMATTPATPEPVGVSASPMAVPPKSPSPPPQVEKTKKELNEEASATARAGLADLNIRVLSDSLEAFGATSHFSERARGRAGFVVAGLPRNIGASKAARGFISAEGVRRVVARAAEAASQRGSVLLLCSWGTCYLITNSLRSMGPACPLHFYPPPTTMQRDVVRLRQSAERVPRPLEAQEPLLALYKGKSHFARLGQDYAYLRKTGQRRTVSIIDNAHPRRQKLLWGALYDGCRSMGPAHGAQAAGLSAAAGSRRRKQARPEQKPVELLKGLALACCKPGGLWHDFMCGAGMAGIAARELGSPAALADIDAGCVDASAPQLLQAIKDRRARLARQAAMRSRRPAKRPGLWSGESSESGSGSDDEQRAGEGSDSGGCDSAVGGGAAESGEDGEEEGGKGDEEEGSSEPLAKKQKVTTLSEGANNDNLSDQELLRLLRRLSTASPVPLRRKSVGQSAIAVAGLKCAAKPACNAHNDAPLAFRRNCANASCARDDDGGGRLHDMCCAKAYAGTDAQRLGLWEEPPSPHGHCSLSCWAAVAKSALE